MKEYFAPNEMSSLLNGLCCSENFLGLLQTVKLVN